MSNPKQNQIVSPELVTEQVKVAPEDAFSDLSKLRLSQDFLQTAGVKKLLMTVPVRKPNPQDFSRVHPDPGYRMDSAVIHLKEDREFYLLTPPIAAALPMECIPMTIYTAINRQGVVFLWPVRLPPSDNKVNEWNRSQSAGAERAMARWVRITSNLSLGAYEITEATGAIPDPTWPEYTFQELLRIAFRDRLVNNPEHAVIKRLQGQV
jgi:hypothetical protein